LQYWAVGNAGASSDGVQVAEVEGQDTISQSASIVTKIGFAETLVLAHRQPRVGLIELNQNEITEGEIGTDVERNRQCRGTTDSQLWRLNGSKLFAGSYVYLSSCYEWRAHPPALWSNRYPRQPIANRRYRRTCRSEQDSS
jgi:hypothetical protein